MITSWPGSQLAGVATLCAGGQLQRVDDAQDLVEVAAGRHRVDEHQLDLLVGADDEHGADGLVGRRGPAVAGAFRVRRQHPVGLGDRQGRVADHREVRGVALRLLDVDRPARVVVHRVDAQTDDLGVALVELRLQLGHRAQLGGADGVKSLGCEKRTPHESPSHWWKLIGPSVVSAVKSGAVSPSCSAIETSKCRIGGAPGIVPGVAARTMVLPFGPTRP